nr:bifunctional metallophosphatase/5'-nucleotidase [uncultured Methanospirillum sp.]
MFCKIISNKKVIIYGCLVLIATIILLFCIVDSIFVNGVDKKEMISVKIIALNDFHGHLFDRQSLNGHPAGSAPVLSAALKDAINLSDTNHIFLALIGDTIGASPRQSTLLMDEPTVLFFNSVLNTNTSLISIPGNHEFDRGVNELMRIVNGGNGTDETPHLVDPYPGWKGDMICANVVWKDNQTPIFPPYIINMIDGIPVAWIGVVTTETPSLTLPQNIDGLEFLNETATVNHYVRILQKQGIHAFIVLLHEGGNQDPYEGQTRPRTDVSGPIGSIVAGMDSDVDVVLSGHKHGFTNAFLLNSGGKDTLLVQAYSYGMAYADVNLQIDTVSRDICNKSAEIIPVYPEPEERLESDANDLVQRVEKAVHHFNQEVIGFTSSDITRSPEGIYGSPLGRLVARSQQEAMGADLAFVTSGILPGSLHADLAAGNITRSDLEAILPPDAEMAKEYGGWYSRPRAASRELNGTQIQRILERQFETPAPEEDLSTSGIEYVCDLTRSPGDRVTGMWIDGKSVEKNKTYLAAMNYYIAYGRGNFTPGWEPGVNVTIGPGDIKALIGYIKKI